MASTTFVNYQTVIDASWLNDVNNAVYNGTFPATTVSFTNISYTGTLTGGTGVVNLGSGQFYKDASGNVGIGTSSPSGKLNVSGTSTTIRITGTDTTSILRFNDGSSDVSQIATAGGDTLVDYQGSLKFRATINGPERMRIDSSGNVGIGTSSPATKLDITGAQVANRGVLEVLDSTALAAGTGAGLTLGGYYNGSSLTPGVQIKAAKTNATSGDYGFDMTFLNFKNGDASMTERMRIDSSGNVGIGTSTANIYSTGSVTNVLGIQASGTNQNGLIAVAGTGSGYSGIDFGNSTIRRSGIYTLDGSALAFYTNGTNSGITISERMRIDASGNLLVGTTSTVASAKVVVSSTTQGFLPPVMTTTQKNAIASPTAGLIVFDTTLSKLCVYSGAAWQTITSI